MSKLIEDLVKEISKSGFRVFLSDSCEHGFYTDKLGSKLISFEVCCGVSEFSGNYKTDQPSQTGTSWGIDAASFKDMFASTPPSYAVGDSEWRFQGVKEHLDTYSSSKFAEQTLKSRSKGVSV